MINWLAVVLIGGIVILGVGTWAAVRRSRADRRVDASHRRRLAGLAERADEPYEPPPVARVRPLDGAAVGEDADPMRGPTYAEQVLGGDELFGAESMPRLPLPTHAPPPAHAPGPHHAADGGGYGHSGGQHDGGASSGGADVGGHHG